MRPIWKGHISFGLVSVPVVLYSAERRSDLSLHLIDSKNFSRVRYERVNEETGEEVPWDRTVKGYEYADGSYVVIGEDELKEAAPEATKSVEIEQFVDIADIDPIYFDKPYYLQPDKKGEKGYVLLRDALEETGRAGIARVVIRTRQYLAALLPREGGLVLMLLRYAQEVRSISELELPENKGDLKITKQEEKMAKELISSMSSDWDPEAFHDEYREKLLAWIEKRIESGEIERSPEAEDVEDAPEPINIMTALKESLAKQKKTSKKKTTKSSKKSKSRGKKAG